MDKIIGKIVLLCVFLVARQIDAQVTLRACSVDNEAISQVVVGQPFLLEVSITNADGSSPNVEIEGLEDFSSQRTGVYLSTVNNLSVNRYTYRVVGSVDGHYTIGPALVKSGGKTQSSNTVSLNVGTHITTSDVQKKASGKRSKKDILNDVRLELTCDKASAFVGQKIVCTLSLMCPEEKIALRTIGQEGYIPFKAQDVKGPTMMTQQIDGKDRSVIQWQWYMYPDRVGHYILPAYSVQTEIESKCHMAAPFFWGKKECKKTIYSNALPLNILPLPDNVPAHMPVGTFSDFRVSLASSMIKEGTATTLVLELEGEGNFDAITINALQDMPDGVKWYSSQQQIIPSAITAAHLCKKFEFTLQGLAGGVWSIPAQTFSYFDEKSLSIKMLKTEPMTITVVRDRNVAPVTKNEDEPSTSASLPGQLPLITKPTVVVENDLNEHITQVVGVCNKSLPWVLFFLLLILPGVGMSAHMFYRWYCRRNARQWLVRDVCAQLEQARQSGDSAVVRTIFLNFLSVRLAADVTSNAQEVIAQRLQHADFSGETIEQWNNFWLSVNECSFGNPEVCTRDGNLFERALLWVKLLDQVL